MVCNKSRGSSIRTDVEIMIKLKKEMSQNIFKNRTVLIATMHGKEHAIAPLLEAALGVKCIVAKNFNSDLFGMFSSEIERAKSPLETARDKAIAAISETDLTLVVASEGSFGPHPASPFLTVNEELLLFIDLDNKLEIRGRFLSTDTNLAQLEIENIKDLIYFEKQVGFPEHAIILYEKTDDGKDKLWKDFKVQDELHIKISSLLKSNVKLIAETDMRAMNNPTRMKNIEAATKDLIKNILSNCPQCNTPGFSIVDSVRGLPCELCNLPTKSLKAHIFKCEKCAYSSTQIIESKKVEDPMYCDFCNP